MGAPLTFEFTPVPEETAHAVDLMRRHGPLGWLAWVVWPLLLVQVVVARLAGTPWRAMTTFFLLAAAMIALVVVIPLVQRRRVRSAVLASEALRAPHRYALDESGMEVRQGSVERRFDWSSVRRVVEVKGFVLFLFGQRGGIILPLRAVPAEQRPELRGLLRRVLGARARLARD